MGMSPSPSPSPHPPPSPVPFSPPFPRPPPSYPNNPPTPLEEVAEPHDTLDGTNCYDKDRPAFSFLVSLLNRLIRASLLSAFVLPELKCP